MGSDYTLIQKIKIRLGQYHMDGNKLVFDDAEENPKLELLISNAIESVRKVRNYPVSWDEDKISKDLDKHENVVINLVIYDYNKEGMDYENSHTESGVTRQFSSRAKVMQDVLPFVDMF